MKTVVLAASAIVAGFAAAASVPARPSLDQQASDVVAATQRFELGSSARMGLLHFLIDWAAADAGAWPPYAPPIAEREDLTGLDDSEAAVWTRAVGAFSTAVGRSFVFDGGIAALRGWAAGTRDMSAIPAADRALAEALEQALPVYARHWWPEHDRRNRAWIASVEPGLRTIETDVVRRIEVAYSGRWPDERIPVDVVPYANPVGAYSTAGRLTLSSVDRDNAAPQGVELVIHEASHVDPLERPLREAVDAAFRAAGGEAPDRFWHDMIFFTAGEVTAIAFEAAGRPDYRHYGETAGVYSRGVRWSVNLPALEAHWRSYLRSGVAGDGRDAALEAVARDVLGGR